MRYMRNNVDMFMLSASWYGKFTPNFEELNNDATDFDEMLYEDIQV